MKIFAAFLLTLCLSSAFGQVTSKYIDSVVNASLTSVEQAGVAVAVVQDGVIVSRKASAKKSQFPDNLDDLLMRAHNIRHRISTLLDKVNALQNPPIDLLLLLKTKRILERYEVPLSDLRFVIRRVELIFVVR